MTSTSHSRTTSTSSPSPAVSRHAWVPYVAVASGAALLLKAVLMIATEDGLADPVEGGLYLGGILLGIVASIGAGLQRRKGLRTLTAVGLSLLLLAFITSLGEVFEPVFAAISDARWVREEGPIGLLGVVLLLLGARGRSTSSR